MCCFLETFIWFCKLANWVFSLTTKLSAFLAGPKNGTTSEGAAISKKENDNTKRVCIEKNSLEKMPKGNKGKLNSWV
jgi:hypothetical protein